MVFELVFSATRPLAVAIRQELVVEWYSGVCKSSRSSLSMLSAGGFFLCSHVHGVLCFPRMLHPRHEQRCDAAAVAKRNTVALQAALSAARVESSSYVAAALQPRIRCARNDAAAQCRWCCYAAELCFVLSA